MKSPDINVLLRARPRSCKYGAPMGAVSRIGEGLPDRLYCQRLRFTDGAYGPDGTYWGAPRNVWAIFSADLSTLYYVRAATRLEALARFHAAPLAPAATGRTAKRIKKLSDSFTA